MRSSSRYRVLKLYVGLAALLSTSLWCQVAPQATTVVDSSARDLILGSLNESLHGRALDDVVLEGKAHIDGASEETAVVVKIKGTDESLATYSAGRVKFELRNDGEKPLGQWADSSGAIRQRALHNSMVPAGVLSPVSTLRSVLRKGWSLQYIGLETLADSSTVHLRCFRTPVGQGEHITQLLEHLSAIDLYLNSTTHLLEEVRFNTHPEDNALRDVPVEIRYREYQPKDGVQIPFRIQRVIHGAMNMDLSVSSVTLNSNLADSEFALK